MQTSGSAGFVPDTIDDTRISYGYAGIIAGYVHPLNDKVKLNLIAIPCISSDYADITGQDVRADFVTLFAHKQSESLTYKYGLLYINGFAGHHFWPLLGLEWTAGKRSTISALLPQYIRYKYQATERFDIGLNIQTQYGTYQMSQQRKNIYLEQQLGQASLSTGVFLTDHLYLQALGGYSVLRNARFFANGDRFDYRIGPAANKERTPINSGYHSGPVGELRLSFLVPAQ